MGTLSEFTDYLAEWYLPEQTELSIDNMVAKLEAAVSMVGEEGAPVRLIATVSVPSDEVFYGVFIAQCSDAVTMACQRGGVPHHRLIDRVGTRIRLEPTIESRSASDHAAAVGQAAPASGDERLGQVSTHAV
jgi:hypothetical protein